MSHAATSILGLKPIKDVKPLMSSWHLRLEIIMFPASMVTVSPEEGRRGEGRRGEGGGWIGGLEKPLILIT